LPTPKLKPPSAAVVGAAPKANVAGEPDRLLAIDVSDALPLGAKPVRERRGLIGRLPALVGAAEPDPKEKPGLLVLVMEAGAGAGFGAAVPKEKEDCDAGVLELPKVKEGVEFTGADDGAGAPKEKDGVLAGTACGASACPKEKLDLLF